MPKVSEAHRHNRRRQILDAAIDCFARQGFQRTSMEDIIREANLSTGAIYSYFHSKDQIIETLADERHQREKDLTERALNFPNWSESLGALFTGFRQALAEPKERKERRLGIHLWSEALCNPKILRLIRRGVRQPLDLLSNAIAQQQAQEKLARDINPDAAARILIALFHGLILQQAWDQRIDATEFAETALAMVSSYLSTDSTSVSPKAARGSN